MYLANSTFKERGKKAISQQTVNSKMPSPHFPSGYNLSPVPQDNSRRVSNHQKVISFNLVFTVCAGTLPIIELCIPNNRMFLDFGFQRFLARK